MSSTRCRRGSDLLRCLRVAACAAGLALGGCVDLDVLTAPTAYSLSLSAGDGQIGLVGWDLSQPVVMRVTNDEGAAVEGLTVQFEVTEGGFAAPASAVTDSAGEVSTRWRLSPSMPGSQTLTARLPWAFHRPPVSVTAEAAGMGQADVVIVHGAVGPVKGAALSEPDGSFHTAVGAAWADTIFPVPPSDAPGREVVVFARGSRPALVAPAWTPGQDTAHVTLEPPVTIDISFVIHEGTYAVREEQMRAEVDTAAAVWSSVGMGVEIGDVAITDSTDAPRESLSEVQCPSAALRDRVQVRTVTDIARSSTVWAIGCPNGDIFVVPGQWVYQYSHFLLAHEIGHTFSLRHTEEGLMDGNPREQDRVLHDGEVFIAHFGETSILNTIYGSEPVAQRRDCDFEPEACLPPLFQVGG